MIVGLTGGIGSGKTKVSDFLAKLGAEILDADIIAREVVAYGSPALREIVENFGPGVLHADGSLDRAKLANIVFNNPNKLQKLNAITHPKITDVVLSKINQHKKIQGSSKMLVLVAPLLIEVGLYKLVDKVWVIHTNPTTQLNRVMQRDKLSKAETFRRINSQLTETERLQYADEVIDNTGSWENTAKKILILWNQYTNCDT